jgi:hypothetical protein
MAPSDRIDLPRRSAAAYVVITIFVLTAPGPVLGIMHAHGPLLGGVLLAAAYLCGVGLLIAMLTRNLRTYLSERGAHQPRLVGRGETFIAWRDIDRIELRGGVGLHLCAGRRKIVLAIHTFKDIDQLWRVIRERAPQALRD